MSTVSQLRQQAKARKIKGYSKMNKAQLMSALGVSEDSRREEPGKSRRSAKASPTKTARAIATAITRKHGGNPAEVEAQLKKSIQSAVDKKRRQLKKEGREPTQKDLRAAAIAGVKATVQRSAKSKPKDEPKKPPAEPKPKKERKSKPKVEPAPPKEEPQQPSKEVEVPAGAHGATLKPKPFNPKAIPDLKIEDFKQHYGDRDLLERQNNPNEAWNQTFEEWKKSGAARTKNEYKIKLTQAIAEGVVPSDKSLESSGVKLSKSQQKQLDDNRASLDERVKRHQKIEDAINHPLVSEEDAKGYKPTLSRAEAEAYTKGSFTGSLSFYHGNSSEIVNDMAGDGIKPDLNDRGLFGRGAYFAAAKNVAEQYARCAVMMRDADQVGLLEIKAKVKNPYVTTSTDIETIGSHVRGEEANMVNAIAISEFLKAKGHDSIYLQDKGYFITFDQKQTVVVDKEDIKSNSDRMKQMESFWKDKRTTMEEEAESAKSDSFKVLGKASKSDKRKYEVAKDDEFF